jgi:hypothetical protein
MASRTVAENSQITGVDPVARSVNVTVVRSDVAVTGIPWEHLVPWDEVTREFFDKTFGWTPE